jgi:hypothetical protein
MHRRLVCSVVWIQAASAMEGELGELVMGKVKEDQIFQTYGNKSIFSDQQRKDWFLAARIGHDVLFQMNPKSSVKDLGLRNKLLMENKHRDHYKDTMTFLLLSIFVPRFAFCMSALTLAKNLSITLGPWGERTTKLQENLELGRYCRLILLGLPLRYLF